MTAAIVRRELRDIAPSAAVLAVVALGLTLLVANAFSLPVSQLALICGGLGAGIGITQGLIDRKRRDDPFLLHRPMSSTRLHALRGAAAAAVATLGAIACCALLQSAPFASSWKAAAAAAGAAGRPGGWTRPLQELPSFSQYVTCVVAALLMHAVVRLAMSARNRLAAAALVIVLPTTVVFAIMSIGTESAPWPVLGIVWLVATALGALQLSNRLPPSSARARAALLLIVVVFVSLEGLRYVATPLWRLQFEVLPRAGVDTEGAVLHWRSRTVHDELGYPWRIQRYDAARRPLDWERAQQPVPPETAAVADLGAPQIVDSPLYEAGSGGPPWMPLHRRWGDRHTRFEGAHLLDRGLPPGTNGLGGGPSWVLRDGRLLMIAPGDEEVVVGSLGPDGWLAGAPDADHERFATSPVVVDSWIEKSTPQGHGTGVVALADADARALFVVSGDRVARPQGGGSWSIVVVELETLTVTRTPLTGEGPIRSLRSPSRYAGCAALAVGDEVVLLRRSDRSLHHMPWEPDDETPAPVAFVATVADQADAPTVLVTRRGEPDVIGARLRFRFVGAADEAIVHDVDLAPVSGAEHAMAAARRGVAVLRPPVLSIASTVSPRPAGHGEMLGWWARDPLYAGGESPTTLVICLLLGAVCALRARSEALLRRPASARAWMLTALLLGPMGLVWLRLTHRRAAVRPCACGRRRAVDLEACPSCGAAWPGPAATGTEVLVAAAPTTPAASVA